MRKGRFHIMSVTKDPERGTWTMYCRYKDWQGNTKEKRKRGFRTKKEAQKYENEFLAMKTKDMHMGSRPLWKFILMI